MQDLARSPRAVHFILGALLRTSTPPDALCAEQLRELCDDDVFAYLFKARCVRALPSSARGRPECVLALSPSPREFCRLHIFGRRSRLWFAPWSHTRRR
jgi:hypothetical protein